MAKALVVMPEDSPRWDELAATVERLRLVDRALPRLPFPRLRDLALCGRRVDDEALSTVPSGLESLALEATSVIELAPLPPVRRLDLSGSRYCVSHGFGSRRRMAAGFEAACRAGLDALGLADVALTPQVLGHALRSSPQLRYLDLGRSESVERVDLASLERLEAFSFADGHARSLILPRSLRSACLFRVRVGALDLSGLEGLEELDLSYAAAGGSIDEVVASLPEGTPLRKLQLEQTGATGKALSLLPRVAPRLEELNLGCCDVEDGDLPPLGRLPRLRQLSLYGTAVTDAGVQRLRGALRLEKLDVRCTRVTDPPEVDGRIVAWVRVAFTEPWT